MNFVDYLINYCWYPYSDEDYELYITEFFLDDKNIHQEIKLYLDRVAHECTFQERNGGYDKETYSYDNCAIERNCGSLLGEIEGYFEEVVVGVPRTIVKKLLKILTIKLIEEEYGN